MVNVSDNCIPLDFLGNGHLNVVLVRTASVRVHEQDFETTYTQYVGDELVHVSVSIEAKTDALASSVLLAWQHKVVLLILLARVELPYIHLNVVLVCKTHDTSQHAVGYAQSVAECFALGGSRCAISATDIHSVADDGQQVFYQLITVDFSNSFFSHIYICYIYVVLLYHDVKRFMKYTQ